MRAALTALPDGRWTFADVLDSAGPRPEQQSPTRVVVAVTLAGDTASFDFTGTDAQRPGTVNAVEAVTVSAVAFAIRAATDPSLPANGGTMRPRRLIPPPRSVGAGPPPAPRGRGHGGVGPSLA